MPEEKVVIPGESPDVISEASVDSYHSMTAGLTRDD